MKMMLVMTAILVVFFVLAIANQTAGIALAEFALGLVLLGAVLAVYFLPSFVARSRHKRNTGAIFVLNLFLGWTLLGWVGALVWAATTDKPAAA